MSAMILVKQLISFRFLKMQTTTWREYKIVDSYFLLHPDCNSVGKHACIFLKTCVNKRSWWWGALVSTHTTTNVNVAAFFEKVVARKLTLFDLEEGKELS